MPTAYISVGSDIGPRRNIGMSLQLLSKEILITRISTFYEIGPFPDGHREDPSFYCGVIEILTDKNPKDLKCQVLRNIEKSLGMPPIHDKMAPKTIALEILLYLYDDYLINEQDVIIPNPDIIHNPFWAIPLCELNSDFIWPSTKLQIKEVIKEFNLKDENMKSLVEYSKTLRLHLAMQ